MGVIPQPTVACRPVESKQRSLRREEDGSDPISRSNLPLTHNRYDRNQEFVTPRVKGVRVRKSKATFE